MKSVIVPLLLAVGLGACATRPVDDGAASLALYEAHADAPVSQFHYFGRAMGWERVDSQHVLLDLKPREAWLLRVAPSCLDWGSGAPTLGLTSRNGLVVARFDKVLVEGSPIACPIEEIRRVDKKAVRAARKALANQASGT